MKNKIRVLYKRYLAIILATGVLVLNGQGCSCGGESGAQTTTPGVSDLASNMGTAETASLLSEIATLRQQNTNLRGEIDRMNNEDQQGNVNLNGCSETTIAGVVRCNPNGNPAPSPAGSLSNVARVIASERPTDLNSAGTGLNSSGELRNGSGTGLGSGSDGTSVSDGGSGSGIGSGGSSGSTGADSGAGGSGGGGGSSGGSGGFGSEGGNGPKGTSQAANENAGAESDADKPPYAIQSSGRGGGGSGGGGAYSGGEGGSAIDFGGGAGSAKTGPGAGVQGSAWDGDRKLASATSPSGSSDPSDYLTRIRPEENIFKVVERRYTRTAIQWTRDSFSAAGTGPDQ